MVALVHSQETRTDALVRLAARARHEGVKLFRDRADGRYYASSASTPGLLHYVTGHSCDCRGFIQHGRCKHYAALMAALGWIEGSPEPTPEPQSIASVPCEHCINGEVPALYGKFSDSFGSWQPCRHCHGTGEQATPVAA